MGTPNTPKINQINLGKQLGEPARSLVQSTQRKMSLGRFYNTMKKKIIGDGAMTEKMAKAVSLRAAVGTNLGVSAKKEKVFFKEMGKANMLSNRFKHLDEYRILEVKDVYHRKVSENSDGKKESISKEVHADEHLSTGKVAVHDETDQSRKSTGGAKNRMQKIREEIEEQKKSQHTREIDTTNNYGSETRKQTVTSIAHVGRSTPEQEVPETHITHIGTDTRQASAVNSVHELNSKHAASLNVKGANPQFFGGQIKAANDNQEISEAENDNQEIDVPEKKFAQLD